MNAKEQQWPPTDDYDELTGWTSDLSWALVILVSALLLGSASGAGVWFFLNLAR